MSDTWLNIRFGSYHLKAKGWDFSFEKNDFHEGKPFWDIELFELRKPFK